MEFEDVLSEYATPVYSFCVRLIGNEDDAKDLSQDIFVKIWRNLEKYDASKSLKAWIFTIARNTCYDWLRKKKNLVFSQMNTASGGDDEPVNFEETIHDEKPLQDELFIQKENAERVEKAIKILPQDQLEVVILHYTENLSFDEIAQILGKSINTVKSQNRRALEKMKKFLENAPK
ncbi:MAG: RNA polymerase sigma factor [bacterium]